MEREIGGKGVHVHELCRLHTGAETEDLQMIAQLRFGECQHRRREEHGLVIGMSDEQTDTLVAKTGKGAGERGRGRRDGPEENGCPDCDHQRGPIEGGRHLERRRLAMAADWTELSGDAR